MLPFTLSEEQFGDALRQVLARKFRVQSTQYRISKSTFAPPHQLTVVLGHEVIDSPIPLGKTPRSGLEYRRFRLSKKEIEHGLTIWINEHRQHRSYHGNQVISLPEIIPGTIEVELIPHTKGLRDSFGGL